MTKHGQSPRRLSHLYRTKTDPIPFEDEVTGEPIEVVVVKPNTHQTQQIERRASAARARAKVTFDDKDSDDAWALRDQAVNADRDSLLSTIVGFEIREKGLSIYYEERAKPEWSEDDHLLGLEVIWHSKEPVVLGLNTQMIAASPPEDEDLDEDDLAEYKAAYDEAIRVRDELARFEEAINKRTEDERNALTTLYQSYTDDDLAEEGVKYLTKIALEKTYSDAYEQQLLYYATRRVDDLTQRYFQTAGEVLELDDEIRDILLIAYTDISVPVLEGKGLPGSPGSSTSSEPIDVVAPSEPSGLADATP